MKKGESRIETKTSRTAEFTCMYRAASYRETRECYKGTDHIAYILVPGFVKLLLRFPRVCQLYNIYLAPKGIYEYVNARTKYIDSVFMDVLEQGFDQIVIFGAGFDSRAQRLSKLNKKSKIFELDTPITQEDKLNGFTEKNIMIPENLIYIPINFIQESLADKLTAAGFEKNQKTLFLLEGVTMYLSDDAIDKTFTFIQDVAGKGSWVVFDYIYAGVLRQENKYYGEKDIFKTVAKAGEAWSFALEEGEIESFLRKYDFNLKSGRGNCRKDKRYTQHRDRDKRIECQDDLIKQCS
jgi:methyltransferase (TIGR00027 family)